MHVCLAVKPKSTPSYARRVMLWVMFGFYVLLTPGVCPPYLPMRTTNSHSSLKSYCNVTARPRTSNPFFTHALWRRPSRGDDRLRPRLSRPLRQALRAQRAPVRPRRKDLQRRGSPCPRRLFQRPGVDLWCLICAHQLNPHRSVWYVGAPAGHGHVGCELLCGEGAISCPDSMYGFVTFCLNRCNRRFSCRLICRSSCRSSRSSPLYVKSISHLDSLVLRRGRWLPGGDLWAALRRLL